MKRGRAMRFRSRGWLAAWRLCLAAVMGLVLAGAPGTATAASDEVFVPGKVWKVHVTLPAKEYEAMQPRGGWGFGGPAKPKPPEKPEGPAREVHRNTFGMDLPWATGSVTVGDETFKDVGIRYKGNGTIS